MPGIVDHRFIPARAGNTRTALGLGQGDRFIPAPAGNTLAAVWLPSKRAGSSPRLRGTLRRLHANATRHGSSPRLRGTLGLAGLSFRFGRFIPAPAGNTLLCVFAVHKSSVHPRAVRGTRLGLGQGNLIRRFIPALRGTHVRWLPIPQLSRFIPARAGNTRSRPSWRSRPIGSSPRVRGTQRERLWPRLCERFIPARAGNTTVVMADGVARTVHPRACGEHLCPVIDSYGNPGSSPRVRGTRGDAGADVVASRFIPARAGNTSEGSRAEN